MNKPDIKIGDKIFQPLQMNLKDRVIAEALFFTGKICADMNFPYQPQYERVVDEMRIGLFYGPEAANAFIDIISPEVRTTIEIQIANQMEQGRWGTPTLIPLADLCQPYFPRYRFISIDNPPEK